MKLFKIFTLNILLILCITNLLCFIIDIITPITPIKMTILSIITAISIYLLRSKDDSIKKQSDSIVKYVEFSGIRANIDKVENFLKLKNEDKDYCMVFQTEQVLNAKKNLLEKINNGSLPSIIYFFREFYYKKYIKIENKKIEIIKESYKNYKKIFSDEQYEYMKDMWNI